LGADDGRSGVPRGRGNGPNSRSSFFVGVGGNSSDWDGVGIGMVGSASTWLVVDAFELGVGALGGVEA
jgi:hypothetical protein